MPGEPEPRPIYRDPFSMRCLYGCPMAQSVENAITQAERYSDDDSSITTGSITNLINRKENLMENYSTCKYPLHTLFFEVLADVMHFATTGGSRCNASKRDELSPETFKKVLDDVAKNFGTKLLCLTSQVANLL